MLDHRLDNIILSSLSFRSKFVEGVVAKHLLEHIHVHNLDKLYQSDIHVHNLDNPYQSAYQTGHSNETALLSINNEVHLSCHISWVLSWVVLAALLSQSRIGSTVRF